MIKINMINPESLWKIFFKNSVLNLFIIILLLLPYLILAEVKKDDEKNNNPPHFSFIIPSDTENFRLDTKLDHPGGVTSYKGDIYISDSFNNRIVAFNELGETLFIIGKKGNNPGEFAGPGHMVCDEDNLFVLDIFNSRVQVFDRKFGDFRYIIDFKEKEEVKKSEGEGGEKQEFKKVSSTPIDIELDTKDKLFVIFKSDASVYVYDKKGDYKFHFGKQNAGNDFGFAAAVGINNFASDIQTKIYVVDQVKYYVHIFNEKGVLLSKFGKHSDSVDGFLMPGIINIDSKGRVYVYDRGKGKCLVFDKEGKFLFQFGREQGLNFAEDMYIDPNNTIYIADTLNNRVVVYKY